jgi:hypothetical protein
MKEFIGLFILLIFIYLAFNKIKKYLKLDIFKKYTFFKFTPNKKIYCKKCMYFKRTDMAEIKTKYTNNSYSYCFSPKNIVIKNKPSNSYKELQENYKIINKNNDCKYFRRHYRLKTFNILFPIIMFVIAYCFYPYYLPVIMTGAIGTDLVVSEIVFLTRIS